MSVFFFVDDVPTFWIFQNTIKATPESVPLFFCCNQHWCLNNFILSNSTIQCIGTVCSKLRVHTQLSCWRNSLSFVNVNSFTTLLLNAVCQKILPLDIKYQFLNGSGGQSREFLPSTQLSLSPRQYWYREQVCHRPCSIAFLSLNFSSY